MGYWAHINGKDYPIADGWTLSEEFSETLDSAIINLPHVFGKINVKPYDDVIIHDYGENGLPNREFGKEFVPSNGHFYRHMLVGNPNGDELSVIREWPSNQAETAFKNAEKAIATIMADESLTDAEKAERCVPYAKIMAANAKRHFYNYSIDLVSETKGLEMVQLPNRTISQPMSLSSMEEDEAARPNSKFDGILYSIPLPTASNWENGMELNSVWESVAGIASRRTAKFAYIGDSDPNTVDFSTFSTMPSKVMPNVNFTLPDWSVSNVTVNIVISIAYLLHWIAYSEVLNTQSFKPKKHWVIVNMGLAVASRWNTREHCIQTIENVLFNNASYPEIVDTKESEDSVSSIPFSVSAEGNYAVFMYVEPLLVNAVDGSSNQFNLFGMNSDGSVPSADSRFLVRWDFSCDSSTVYKHKHALTVAEAVRQAIEVFSPYVKVTNDGKTWHYERKYRLDEDTYAFFNDFIAPENQWSNPNLRDFITRLFYVADCIPVVKDGVISAMNLSKRTGDFKLEDNHRSYVNETMDGGSYCDRLMRVYTDGLSKNNVVKCYDRIGFKNMNNPTLTLDNMELELSHPIYRINKVYMCYYAKYSKMVGGIKKYYMRLTKQDITPLVLLSAKRNLLSEDWNSLDNVTNTPKDINELAKFKYATIGYDIGSDRISGWGVKYSHPTAVFWSTTKTVIENILDFVMKKTKFGVYVPSENMQGFEQNSDNGDGLNSSDELDSVADENRLVLENDGAGGYMQSVVYSSSLSSSPIYGKYFSRFTQALKTMVFEIEYEGYVSASVIASKDIHDGNVVSRDNASSSLSFVESDGINQKEKANRLGNPTVAVSGRHVKYEDVQKLASVWNEKDDGNNWVHNDEVLYRRTIRFDEDYVTASYYLCKNYILRNYFTSVYAKHRPFPLTPYYQSVERHENRTLQLLFSPRESYWQDQSKRMDFSYDVAKLVSFHKPTHYDSVGNLVTENGIDSFFYGVYQSDENPYAGQVGFFVCDAQKFVSGNSLCFVVCMKDSVSAGTYVANFNHNVGAYVGEVINKTISLVGNDWQTSTDELNATQLLTGSMQDWFMFPVDPRTGMMYSMSFSVGFMENDPYATNSLVEYSTYDIAQSQLLPLFDAVVKRALPYDEYVYFGQEISGKFVGCGYPYLLFTEDYDGGGWNGRYYVYYEDKNRYFPKDETMVVSDTAPENFANANVNSNGDVIIRDRGARPLVTEFLRAKFVGRETKDSDESDTCVFKDGKEKMSMTLQIEPISDSGAVMFSSYMMKLSDALGGMRKDYVASEFSNRVSLMFGNSLVKARVSATSASGDYGYSSMCIPTLSICVPKDARLDSGALAVERSWTLNNRFDASFNYEFTLHSITLIDPAERDPSDPLYDPDFPNGKMAIEYSYSFGTRGSASHASMILPKKADDEIRCVSGKGDMPSANAFGLGDAFDTYVMFDDRHLYAQVADAVSHFEANVYYKFSTHDFVIPSNAWWIDWDWTRNYQNDYDDMLRGTSADEIPDPANWPLSYDDACLEYGNCDFSQIEVYYGTTSWREEYGSFNNFVIEQGPSIDLSRTPRNMFWVFSDPMGKDTPYDTMSKIEENVDGFDPVEDIIIERFAVDDLTTAPLGSNSYPWRMRFTLPSAMQGKRSLRMYYLEDGVYHFVFGINLAPKAGPFDQEDNDFAYPTNEEGTEYCVYLSFLDDRSKTVIDANTSDPSYEVANLIENGNLSSDGTAFNMCVEKE